MWRTSTTMGVNEESAENVILAPSEVIFVTCLHTTEYACSIADAYHDLSNDCQRPLMK